METELPLFNFTTASVNIIRQTRVIEFVVNKPLQIFRIAYVLRNDALAPVNLFYHLRMARGIVSDSPN